MEHTIVVHGTHVAVIQTQNPTQHAVTVFVDDVPTVTYDATTYADAERWAKAVIEYPENT